MLRRTACGISVVRHLSSRAPRARAPRLIVWGTAGVVAVATGTGVVYCERELTTLQDLRVEHQKYDPERDAGAWAKVLPGLAGLGIAAWYIIPHARGLVAQRIALYREFGPRGLLMHFPWPLAVMLPLFAWYMVADHVQELLHAREDIKTRAARLEEKRAIRPMSKMPKLVQELVNGTVADVVPRITPELMPLLGPVVLTSPRGDQERRTVAYYPQHDVLIFVLKLETTAEDTKRPLPAAVYLKAITTLSPLFGAGGEDPLKELNAYVAGSSDNAVYELQLVEDGVPTRRIVKHLNRPLGEVVLGPHTPARIKEDIARNGRVTVARADPDRISVEEIGAMVPDPRFAEDFDDDEFVFNFDDDWDYDEAPAARTEDAKKGWETIQDESGRVVGHRYWAREDEVRSRARPTAPEPASFDSQFRADARREEPVQPSQREQEMDPEPQQGAPEPTAQGPIFIPLRMEPIRTAPPAPTSARPRAPPPPGRRERRATGSGGSVSGMGKGTQTSTA